MPSPLSRLFVRWEEALDQGRELSPEELAAGRPELLAPLREGLALLKRMWELGGSTASVEAATVSPLAPADASTVPPGTDPFATAPPSPGGAAASLGDAPAGYEVLGELGTAR